MRVLIAFDGSPGAAEAVNLAQSVEWPADSALRIVSVVQPGAWIQPLPHMLGTASPVLEPELVTHLESLQADVVRGFRISVQSEVLRGRPATTIIDDARSFGADVIIVGSRGHGPIASLLLGSVSAEVVDHGPAPVFVARRSTLRRVVLGTDDSPAALAAEEILIRWPIFASLPIDVVSVAHPMHPWAVGVAPGFQRAALEAYASDLSEAMEESAAFAAAAATRLRQAGRVVRSVARSGNPAAEIIAVAQQAEADLIVVGSRGRSALAEILLGSVARNVLAGSEASVLIVRQPASSDGGHTG